MSLINDSTPYFRDEVVNERHTETWSKKGKSRNQKNLTFCPNYYYKRSSDNNPNLYKYIYFKNNICKGVDVNNNNNIVPHLRLRRSHN